jgi:hypothetical protein
VPEDPYADPVTGVLRNKLGLSTTGELETAEREITHAALIFLKESPHRSIRRDYARGAGSDAKDARRTRQRTLKLAGATTSRGYSNMVWRRWMDWRRPMAIMSAKMAEPP